MITIDQLLKSVDLDFEPRWVTKNVNGGIYVWATRPHYRSGIWFGDESVDSYIAKLKLAEFEGKSSDECIYEVPRKEEPKDKIKIGTLYIDKSVTFGDGDDDDVGFALEDYEVPRKTDEYEQNLEKLRPADSDLVYRVNLPRKTTGKIEKLEPLNGLQHNWLDKINELVDAVNELKGAKNE